MEAVFVHTLALVETEQIGAGTSIWAYTHVMPGATIGKHCNIGDHCFVESGAVVGDNVTIKNGNMLWAGVTLANGVFVGPQVCFTNDLYPRSARHPAVNQRSSAGNWLVPTLVCEGASLGAGVVVRGGIVIGAFAMVGAGALVTCDVPPYALVVGNPARPHGWVCRCGLPLVFEAGESVSCICGRTYLRNQSGVQLTRALVEDAGQP